MLNTKKLLYILPDVAYVAELLPGKKQHSFSIQTFRQINGEFFEDDEFISENIVKLFGKLESEEYTVVLPDFLFTNTILEIAETADSAVESFLKKSLLPSLSISRDSHQIDTFTLTQYNNKTRVQLTALEKIVLEPLRAPAAKNNLTINEIVPLSWTIKSIVSLEPSITVVQIGSSIFLAQHYIGVDQTTYQAIQDVEGIAETIATLKGAEPSIQTVYLLTNDLVEQKLKDHLSGTLPLQQLTSKGDDSDLPPYVKQIIESAMTTLSVPDFTVPSFELGQSVGNAAVANSDTAETDPDSTSTETLALDEDDTESDVSDTEEIEVDSTDSDTNGQEEELVKPTAPEIQKAEDTDSTASIASTAVGGTLGGSSKEDDQAEEYSSAISEVDDKDEDKDEAKNKKEDADDSVKASKEDNSASSKESTEKAGDITVESTDNEKKDNNEEKVQKDDQEDKLAQFAYSNRESDTAPEDSSDDQEEDNSDTSEKDTSSSDRGAKRHSKRKKKRPRKHGNSQSELGTFLKMAFISIAVFFATVGIGVGLGLGFLELSGEDQPTSPTVSPTPTTSATASPTPSPSPSPSPAVELSSLEILVVNDTTIPGQAGTIRDALIDAGATADNVSASNSAGDYEAQNLILLPEDATASAQIQSLVEEAAGFSLEPGSTDQYAIEAGNQSYDAIVVFADPDSV